MSRRTCQCREGDYVEAIYLLGGVAFDDSYCGLCSLPWNKPKPEWSPTVQHVKQETKGTSTSEDEGAAREIGRAVFGITYPEDKKGRDE